MKKTEEVGVVKVEKIVIKIGDREDEYTMEEAKKLQELLNQLLGNKETIFVPISYPVPYPNITIYPTYPKTYPYYPNTAPWIVTYVGDSGDQYVSPTITCSYKNAGLTTSG